MKRCDDCLVAIHLPDKGVHAEEIKSSHFQRIKKTYWDAPMLFENEFEYCPRCGNRNEEIK